MKKEEAIKIIEQVCDKYVGVKAEHIAIEQAFMFIKSELEKTSCTCKECTCELKKEEIK